MDVFPRLKFSTEVLLHNVAMLSHNSSIWSFQLFIFSRWSSQLLKSEPCKLRKVNFSETGSGTEFCFRYSVACYVKRTFTYLAFQRYASPSPRTLFGKFKSGTLPTTITRSPSAFLKLFTAMTAIGKLLRSHVNNYNVNHYCFQQSDKVTQS